MNTLLSLMLLGLCANSLGARSNETEEHAVPQMDAQTVSETSSRTVWRRSTHLNRATTTALIVGVIGGVAMLATIFLAILLLARKHWGPKRGRDGGDYDQSEIKSKDTEFSQSREGAYSYPYENALPHSPSKPEKSHQSRSKHDESAWFMPDMADGAAPRQNSLPQPRRANSSPSPRPKKKPSRQKIALDLEQYPIPAQDVAKNAPQPEVASPPDPAAETHATRVLIASPVALAAKPSWLVLDSIPAPVPSLPRNIVMNAAPVEKPPPLVLDVAVSSTTRSPLGRIGQPDPGLTPSFLALETGGLSSQYTDVEERPPRPPEPTEQATPPLLVKKKSSRQNLSTEQNLGLARETSVTMTKKPSRQNLGRERANTVVRVRPPPIQTADGTNNPLTRSASAESLRSLPFLPVVVSKPAGAPQPADPDGLRDPQAEATGSPSFTVIPRPRDSSLPRGRGRGTINPISPARDEAPLGPNRLGRGHVVSLSADTSVSSRPGSRFSISPVARSFPSRLILMRSFNNSSSDTTTGSRASRSRHTRLFSN